LPTGVGTAPPGESRRGSDQSSRFAEHVAHEAVGAALLSELFGSVDQQIDAGRRALNLRIEPSRFLALLTPGCGLQRSLQHAGRHVWCCLRRRGAYTRAPLERWMQLQPEHASVPGL